MREGNAKGLRTTMLYKYHGEKAPEGIKVQKVHRIENIQYKTFNADEVEEALENGWFKSPTKAKEMFEKVLDGTIYPDEPEKVEKQPEEVKIDRRDIVDPDYDEQPEAMTNQDVYQEYEKETDSDGFFWDERIHLQSKEKNKNGIWKIIPGTKKEQLEKVRAETKAR